MRAALVLTVLICLFNGGFVAWSIAGLRADQRVVEARAIGEGNLARAEACVAACLHDGYCIFGTAIYRCRTEKSDLTTAQVPELGKSIAVF